MLKKVSLIESWPVLDQDNVFRSDCVQQKCKECKCCTWVKRKASRNSVMCPTIRLVLNMAANKNKEFLFFGFYKFFVFCKIFRSKKQKIEIWSNYCPFFNFLEYLQKNIEILFLKIHFYGVFMWNLQKIVHNLEYFLKE